VSCAREIAKDLAKTERRIREKNPPRAAWRNCGHHHGVGGWGLLPASAIGKMMRLKVTAPEVANARMAQIIDIKALSRTGCVLRFQNYCEVR
jgi:hypothetical protein